MTLIPITGTDPQPTALEIGGSLRSFEAEFHLRAGGDGRTVEAYGVPFDEPAEVIDFEGHYMEVFRRGAFAQSIKNNRHPAVLFNHGRDMGGRPSERFAMPIGTPVELREDGRGLYTVTRYARSELADQVLDLIKDGAIRGQSIQFLRTPRGGGSRLTERGHEETDLDLMERLNVVLVEYGPAPIPVYQGATIEKVRARQISQEILAMSPQERGELAELLRAGSEPAPSGGSVPPPDTSAASGTEPPDDTAGPEPSAVDWRSDLNQLAVRSKEKRSR